MRIIVLLAFLGIVASLVSAGVYLMQDRGSTNRMVYALTIRIGLSILLFLFMLLAWRLVRSITQPLDRAVLLADQIAAGDLTADVHDDRGDELGHLLRSLSAMAARLRSVVGEISTVL